MSFWNEKKLEEMSIVQWESLCDGCGKCCLNKLIDDETEELYYTNAACHLLDDESGGCRRYPERFKYVPACTAINADNVAELTWLPDSCAYKRLYQGKTLPSWHPLLTGSKEAMHEAGISVKGKTINETKVRELEDYIVLWPLKDVE
ncbi:YcgN family cysteine cluster protein [Shewanella sp. 10N.286.51.B2]|uniref:YcgN family cysteine cluster protein n=1 Tax=unclassified Shewanella TaxID=196818 RepID=UPI0026E17C49|nr:YcgN family cysteine cluster protein [Shewanella sp. 6_MG-2023]MDO6619295.1 YcgN family cysteine cluster protein [Shewanella sp. 6_MG-2023]